MNSPFGVVATNDKRPRISIVTVCLNDLSGLQATHASVRAQTLPPHQWIVADGQSSDGTQAWLEALDWPLLRWSSGRDGGIYEGMNKGLYEVDAEYVLFLNSGDELCDPEALATVATFLGRCASPPALVYGDCFVVDSQQRSFLRRARPAWWVWLGMPTTHQAMYFRKDALCNGFDTRYRLLADYDSVARLYMAHRGADFVHFPRALCRFHLGGRSDQDRQTSLHESHEVRRRVLGLAAVPACLLHGAHHAQGWIKKYVPAVHRVMRYG